MALRVYNTLSRSVEPFEPLDPSGKKVGMYCCGPTIHDYAHIGNFRTMVFSDLFRRYLEAIGFDVTHVMNVTDVEDKIIRRTRESGKSLADYTAEYERAFWSDFDALGCLRPHKAPRATEHIGNIIGLIKKLEAKGFAYRAGDGSVYFSIQKYREAGRVYGQLLNLNFEEMRQGERVKSDEYEKDAVADFALWKARTAEDGEAAWQSPWGEGRPGWHIECSAMSMKLLGESFDVHLGGEDLIFPHHEDEIAQSEGACGARFVKYWLHGAHLLVEGRKMAKSSGNFFTLRDLLEKGHTGREIRYSLISAHYRDQYNFTFEGLAAARAGLSRLDECLLKLTEAAGGDNGAEPEGGVLSAFHEAMDDDLNVAKAWGAVFDWVRDANRVLAAGAMSPPKAAARLAAWRRMDRVLGVGADLAVSAPPEIEALMNARQEARRAKDFARADALRDELAAAGWTVEDTPKGPRLKTL